VKSRAAELIHSAPAINSKNTDTYTNATRSHNGGRSLDSFVLAFMTGRPGTWEFTLREPPRLAQAPAC
jgi:hypothetical protein